jgi:AAA+ ATPase superfamily predicted ATPase
MIGEFIDRAAEISLLEEEWAKEKGRLIVLYGRIRIGKTRLLREFIKTKNMVAMLLKQRNYLVPNLSRHLCTKT